MEGTAVQRRLSFRPRPWQVATVTGAVGETPSVRTIDLAVPDWPGHRAGQHLDVRLTAEDGYTAERSYSIASAPGDPVAITVERLEDGEVSPYLTEELRIGDQLELRGPVGGYFVWEEALGGPQLVDEVRRDLAVVDPLDGELEVLVAGRRRDRVAALRLVAVLGREPDVDVLAREVAGPVGRVEHDRARAGRLVAELDDGRELPAQSPA